jgi:hypothetical protein
MESSLIFNGGFKLPTKKVLGMSFKNFPVNMGTRMIIRAGMRKLPEALEIV